MKHLACLACGKLPLSGGGCCVILGVGFIIFHTLPCSGWSPPIAGSALSQPLPENSLAHPLLQGGGAIGAICQAHRPLWHCDGVPIPALLTGGMLVLTEGWRPENRLGMPGEGRWVKAG